MPAHNANLRAEGMLAQWNFPNNYTFSKHLAEYMVADYQKRFNMPVAIVRPTLISSVARDPYPGARQGWSLRWVMGGISAAAPDSALLDTRSLCVRPPSLVESDLLTNTQYAPGVAAAAAAAAATAAATAWLMPGTHFPVHTVNVDTQAVTSKRHHHL
jgi:hypothetical protein